MTAEPSDGRDEQPSRKVLSILFCDLVGSTKLPELADIEDARNAMRSYRAIVSEAVKDHEGRVEECAGNAVVALFEVPPTRLDDAARALHAATAALRAIEKLRSTHPRNGVDLSLRIGINTAEVVLTGGADPETFVGRDAMNVAARLQESAAPGEILISESTYEACASIAVAESVPPIRARGRTEPVLARRLLDVLEVPGRALIGVDVPLVGRGDELEEMMSVLDRHASGEPSVIVLAGPPGVGKSRLAREFLARAGLRAVRARAKPPSEAPESSLLHEFLDRAGLSRPGLLSLSDLTTADVDAALTLLGNAVDILALDDAQNASERLLERMVASITDEPGTGAKPLILLVGRPELSATLGDSDDRTAIITLGPLSEGEVESLVRNVVAPSGIQSLPEIATAADGNPLYARELARSAASTRSIGVAPGLRALISSRLDEVSEPERELLQIAAIIGPKLSTVALTDLASAAGAEAPDETLSRLIARQMLTTEPGSDDVAFESALTHEVIMASLENTDRARLHELRAALCTDPSNAAHHLLSAAEALPDGGDLGSRRADLARKAALLLEMPHPPRTQDARAGLSARVAAIIDDLVLLSEVSKHSTVTGPTLGGETGKVRPHWMLHYRGRDGDRSELELWPSEASLVIGRNPDCELSIDWDEEVSRRHAELHWTGSEWRVIDLDSRNGTWIDGARVKKARLVDGSQLRIGTVTFSVEFTAPAAADPQSNS